MGGGLRISPLVASPILLLGVAASFFGIVYAHSLSDLPQVLTMLISMVLVFFASHPLGHFFSARIYGVETRYFFLGKSDFRKLPLKPARLAGGLVLTVGTKLKKEDLAKLPPRRRGYIFGAGVIVSNALVGIEFLYVLAAGFTSPAVVVATLFLVGVVATEVLFSTKVGDLAKMRKEFRNSMPNRSDGNHSQ